MPRMRKIVTVIREEMDGSARHHPVTMNTWTFYTRDGLRHTKVTAESFFEARRLAAMALRIHPHSIRWDGDE